MNNWPHWKQATPYFTRPFASGLQCICRMSNPLLQKINEFAIQNNKLTFLEVMFTTIAYQNNMKMNQPIEFNEIVCNDKNRNEIDPTKLYHPMKNYDKQKELREQI